MRFQVFNSLGLVTVFGHERKNTQFGTEYNNTVWSAYYLAPLIFDEMCQSKPGEFPTPMSGDNTYDEGVIVGSRSTGAAGSKYTPAEAQ